MLSTLGTGLVLIANGGMAMLHALASWMTFALVALIGSVWWLAVLEVDDLNRRGAKPEVARH